MPSLRNSLVREGAPPPRALRTSWTCRTPRSRRALEAYGKYRTPDLRFASFDYCFSYFQAHRQCPERLVQDMRVSCLNLWAYLASWGMLRASSQLFSCSFKALEPAIRAIAGAPPMLWTLDVHNYSASTIATVMDFANDLAAAVFERVPEPGHVPSDTLRTKILLGVFGCVPAYDSYVVAALQSLRMEHTIGAASLLQLQAFYHAHRAIIDTHHERTRVLDFATGSPTALHYTRAKALDMVFFTLGEPLVKARRSQQGTDDDL